MPRLTFRGPGHRLIAFGREPMLLGQSDEFTEDEAESLASQDIRMEPAEAAEFSGEIDEVDAYPRALSLAEIQALHEDGELPPEPEAL